MDSHLKATGVPNISHNMDIVNLFDRYRGKQKKVIRTPSYPCRSSLIQNMKQGVGVTRLAIVTNVTIKVT